MSGAAYAGSTYVAESDTTITPPSVGLIMLIAAAKLGLHLLTNGLYGYHRDELY